MRAMVPTGTRSFAGSNFALNSDGFTVSTEVGATRKVLPSGRALITSETEMLPLPPGRFSTMTEVPSASARGCATTRASRSVPPPGAKPTTKRIGFDGHSAAWPAAGRAAPASVATAQRVRSRRGMERTAGRVREVMEVFLVSPEGAVVIREFVDRLLRLLVSATRFPDRVHGLRVDQRAEVAGVFSEQGCADDAAHQLRTAGARQVGHEDDLGGPERAPESLD